MSQAQHAFPGHFPLAPGRSVSLEPRLCGKLRIAAGALALDGRPVAPGEKLTLWRGDKVQLLNPQGSAMGHFAWDVCQQQPSLIERMRRALRRRAG